ncbi:Anaerobic magnesium-protoporphyrin IX monomethyl ester cyclase [subsurface metagenome]
MLELANNWQQGGDDISNIKNLWFKKGGVVLKNDLRPLLSTLDDLPYPDYDLFDCAQVLKDRKGDFAVIASRGCPFSCSNCCNHALREAYKGKGRYFRVPSVDNVLEQIELLTKKYPIRSVNFADDVFALSREWALEFCEKYPRRFDLKFKCNVRADMIDEELLENLKRANCTEISMGVETGNEWLRMEVLDRKMPNEQIINVFDAAHKLGIETLSYNMIGLPYETPEMVEETINLNKQIAPDHVAVFFFYPYPGTKLHEICSKEGFLTRSDSTSYISESILELPTITAKELDRLYAKFYRYAMQREMKSAHWVIRYPFRLIDYAFGRLLTKRVILALMKIYLKFFRIFSLLRSN